MNIETPFVVVSCDTLAFADSPDVAESRRDTFEHQLRARGIDFKRVEGSYKGAREVSYVALTPDTASESAILRLARRYGQESVLLVDANRFATLAFLHPDVGGPDVRELKGIGFWREASKAEAEAVDGFTRDGERYFVTRALP